MAAKKIDIMDVRQLIQLKIRGESNRSCSSSLAIHRNTVNYYVRQLKATGTSYPDLLSLTDTQLSELFPCRSASDSDRYEELASCFSYFKQQLLLPGGTREALWKEYLHTHPEGYGYTPVSYTHLRAHETRHDLVCRLLLEKKNKKTKQTIHHF